MEISAVAFSRWWVVLLPCALAACATTPFGPQAPPPDLETQCNAGELGACEAWGHRLAYEGQPDAAMVAFGRACAGGVVSSCLEEGRLRVARGDLDGAEQPLRRAYEADSEDGAEALANLQSARGNEAEASRLRFEALAMDKSTTEVVMAYRVGLAGDSGFAIDLNVQPMAFLARRLNVGVNLAIESSGYGSLNGYVGYQYFLTSWAAPYARVLLGAPLARGSGPEVGFETGMKLFGGALAHLGVALGSSRLGSTYMTLELGMDWVLFLMFAAQIR